MSLKIVDTSKLEYTKQPATAKFESEYTKEFKLVDKLSGIEFIGRLFNSSELKPSKDLYVHVMPFIYDYDSPLVDETYLAMVSACPDISILSICLERTKLNSKQLKSLKEDGFDFIANCLLKGLGSLDFKNLLLGGGSMGAAIATRMAALASNYNFEVKLLDINVPVGLIDVSRLNQIVRVLKTRGNDKKISGKKVKKLRTLSTKNRVFASELRKSMLQKDVITSLEKFKHIKVWIFFGEKDFITDAKSARQLHKDLEKLGHNDRVHFIELKDLGHYKGIYNWPISYMHGQIISGKEPI